VARTAACQEKGANLMAMILKVGFEDTHLTRRKTVQFLPLAEKTRKEKFEVIGGKKSLISISKVMNFHYNNC
jgi:hypothetical protein